MRKKTTKKSRRRTDSFKEQFNHEIKGVFLIGVGLLLLVGMHSLGAGRVGEWIRTLLMGLFSSAAMILPYITILLGILTLINTSFWKDGRSIWYFTVIFSCILIYITLWDMAFIEGLKGLNLVESLRVAYVWGREGVSGGALGISLTYLLVSLFGRVGSYIIVTCLVIVSTMIYTKVSLLQLIRAIQRGLKGTFVFLKEAIENFIFVPKEEPKPKAKAKSNPKESQDKKLQMLQQMEIFEQDLAIAGEEVHDDRSDKIKILDFAQTEDGEETPTVQRKTGVDPEQTVRQEDNQGEEIKVNLPQPSEVPYELPSLDLLNQIEAMANKEDKKRIVKKAKVLEDTLLNFGVEAKVIQVSKGPVITRYELQPNVGVKVSKIVNLSDDIALNMAAPAIRIEAPIPGKAAIGIEIPNEDVSTVTLREVLDSNGFQNSTANIPFALGKDISGNPVIADISKMPHLLVAGATGSGKSVCINTLILSILYSAKPENVKLLLIDPKVVELNQYNGIPHLLIPVVTDPKKATSALNWAVQEMTRRYQLFAENGVKDISSYNEKGLPEKLPFVVIIIDELADLMMVAANDVEDAICRLAQMARAAGLHLILATQRPSVDIITGVIKANIPSRIAFSVASQTDSRTILDMGGAEKLLGKGDMLFYPIGANKPLRVQGAFVSEKEVDRVVAFIKEQREQPQYETEIINKIDSGEITDMSGSDDFFEKAVEMVVESQQASISMLQRRLRIGYNRAARLIDEMEEKGIVGPHEGSKPRQVLIGPSEIIEQNKMG
ncbi:FtsK/SpoIIIE family DNA translocase [Alkaliphilus crotonatoxidans]